MLLKRGQVLLSPEKCPLIWTLMKSRGGRPANSDHTATRSAKNTCRKSSIFNIAIAFLFSSLFVCYRRSPIPRVLLLNAFLLFFFLNFDATWHFQRANVLLLFKENQEEAVVICQAEQCWTDVESESQSWRCLRVRLKDLSWGDGVKEWVEPTQWSRRFLAQLAGLEVSPQYSNPHSRLPHHTLEHLHTQKHPSPSWMYFPTIICYSAQVL